MMRIRVRQLKFIELSNICIYWPIAKCFIICKMPDFCAKTLQHRHPVLLFCALMFFVLDNLLNINLFRILPSSFGSREESIMCWYVMCWAPTLLARGESCFNILKIGQFLRDDGHFVPKRHENSYRHRKIAAFFCDDCFVASDNRGGTTDRSASSPARRMTGAPPKKSIFLKKTQPKIVVRAGSDGDF